MITSGIYYDFKILICTALFGTADNLPAFADIYAIVICLFFTTILIAIPLLLVYSILRQFKGIFDFSEISNNARSWVKKRKKNK